MTAKESGTLYLCATPIGNLEDITYRAVRLLKEADLICAEDTRHTRKLLAAYDIHTPLTAYHEHNKRTAGPQLAEKLAQGQNIVCVTDAGLPGISDPGSDLVRLAVERGIRVTPLPGANAALSALICSGLPTDMFTFVGFLPTKHKERQQLLEDLRTETHTLVFYEAPHRLHKTLAELAENFGNGRRAVLARELTKKFETFSRKTLGELIADLATEEARGEYVLLVAGASECADAAVAPNENTTTSEPPDAVRLYETLVAGGTERKAAQRQVAKELNISRREVYQAILRRQEQNVRDSL